MVYEKIPILLATAKEHARGGLMNSARPVQKNNCPGPHE
jgi:hypothetical protein